MNILRNEACWISPTGTLVEVKITHIRTVIDNPEIFDYNLREIRQLYFKNREPLGFEGKARDKLMKDLILKGWVRIRWKPKKYQYTVQMIRNEKVSENLNKWLESFDEEPDIEVLFL